VTIQNVNEQDVYHPFRCLVLFVNVSLACHVGNTDPSHEICLITNDRAVG